MPSEIIIPYPMGNPGDLTNASQFFTVSPGLPVDFQPREEWRTQRPPVFKSTSASPCPIPPDEEIVPRRRRVSLIPGGTAHRETEELRNLYEAYSRCCAFQSAAAITADMRSALLHDGRFMVSCALYGTRMQDIFGLENRSELPEELLPSNLFPPYLLPLWNRVEQYLPLSRYYTQIKSLGKLMCGFSECLLRRKVIGKSLEKQQAMLASLKIMEAAIIRRGRNLESPSAPFALFASVFRRFLRPNWTGAVEEEVVRDRFGPPQEREVHIAALLAQDEILGTHVSRHESQSFSDAPRYIATPSVALNPRRFIDSTPTLPRYESRRNDRAEQAWEEMRRVTAEYEALCSSLNKREDKMTDYEELPTFRTPMVPVHDGFGTPRFIASESDSQDVNLTDDRPSLVR